MSSQHFSDTIPSPSESPDPHSKHYFPNTSLADWADQARQYLWGTLHPLNSELVVFYFWRLQSSYNIGRRMSKNNLVLPGPRVSNEHCKVERNGKEGEGFEVVVYDYSSNGTFINGERIGRDNSRILHSGDEIAFGRPYPRSDGCDYRFIYEASPVLSSPSARVALQARVGFD